MTKAARSHGPWRLHPLSRSTSRKHILQTTLSKMAQGSSATAGAKPKMASAGWRRHTDAATGPQVAWGGGGDGMWGGEAARRGLIVERGAHEMGGGYDAAAPATLLKIDSGPMAAVLTNLYGEFRHADACSSLAIQGLILQLLAALS